MKRTLSTIGAGTALLLALTACGGTSEPAETTPATTDAPTVEVTDLDSLITAAQAEGSLRVYGQIPEDSMTAFAEAFQEKYGIAVESLRLGGNTLASRFEAEVQAGSPTGEVLTATDLEFIGKATERGDIVGFSESGIADFFDGFPEEAVLEDYDAPILQIVDTGFIYNTDKVKESELPKEWSELAGDRWAGKYCGSDPTQSASMAHFMWALRDSEGEEALKALGDNIGRWYPNVIAMNEAVAVGECELGINGAKFFVRAMQGSGAAVEFAKQPSALYAVVTAAIAADAEHPNAARLFAHFILSEEGNALMNNPDNGAFGPWHGADFPADFAAPSPAEYETVRAETPDVLRILGF